MLKEQASPFWNAEIFYSQIITSTSSYIVILKINWPWQIRQKMSKRRKIHLFGPNLKIDQQKWWETIISVYEPLFRNPVCTSFPK